jgi:hypothetical protein
MPLSTFNFERPIPEQAWGRIGIIAAAIVLVATIGWELRVRALGYGPSYNDTPDFWAEQRSRVKPDSVVIIGDSRAWYNLDLGELEKGLGNRPIQLALPGSCAYPVLAHFADDPTFRGTVLCSIVPGMFFAPGGFLLANSEKALKRYRDQTPAQWIGHKLGLPLESVFAFLNKEDLALRVLVNKIQLPNRLGTQLMPQLPPYFCHNDRERRARMTPQAEHGPLRDRIRAIWVPLFTPPPPPPDVPPESFQAQMAKAMDQRMKDTVSAVTRIRERGGEVIFIRFPVTGEVKKLEDQFTPRERIWDPMIQLTAAPGIYFTDYPELADFECPEWSHLSAADSVEFTRRLVPHLLRTSTRIPVPQVAKSSAAAQ